MLLLRRLDMFIIKVFLKVMLIPVVLLLTLLRILVGIGNKLVSVPLGLSLLIVFACIVFAGSQKMWSSMLILIAIEAGLIVLTTVAGLLEEVLVVVIDSIRTVI